jgi:radical SAM protein with 4Fe4S-binding SPASM domain
MANTFNKNSISKHDADAIALNTNFDDPLLERKKSLNSAVHLYKDIPLPSIVEISESGTCNRVCSFCPRSASDFDDRKEFIKEHLVSKLAQELAEVSYTGLILFSGFVEPLLDVNIASHISALKIKNPQCRIEMVTNGDPITINNLNRIYDAGLDTLLVSCYDGEHQIEEISSKISRSKMPENFIVFRKRWVGANENFGISLSNRGGMMSKAAFSIESLDQPWDHPCYYPANTFFLDYTGDVLMCAHDWGKKAVVGDLNTESFYEIWTGRKFSNLRKNLLIGNRSFNPCNVCNVEGTRMGIEHAKAWEDYYNKKI